MKPKTRLKGFFAFFLPALLPAFLFSSVSPIENYLALLQDHKSEEASKVQGVSAFLKRYGELIRKIPYTAQPLKEDRILLDLIALGYAEEDFALPGRESFLEDREQPFYYLAAALQSTRKQRGEYSLKFFFQAFYLFSQWKNRYPLEDRVVFLNEWYYHFSKNLKSLAQSEARRSPYLISTLLNSADLAFQIPYAYFMHPRLNPEDISGYLIFSADLILERDSAFELSSNPEFRMPVFKMYLVSGVSLWLERNYLKADLYFSKLLSYFEEYPVSEDLFLVYQEALKNKILISSRLESVEETARFLKKYLDYSRSVQRLAENWEELKESVLSDSRAEEVFQSLEIKKVLKAFRLI